MQILYRDGIELPSLVEKTIILIDDGVATGATMIATARALRASGVKELIVAVPVAPHEIIGELSRLTDDLVVPYTPFPFMAVREVCDEEVKEYLEEAKKEVTRYLLIR